MQTALQLLLIWVFDATLQLNLDAFLLRIAVYFFAWCFYFLLCALEAFFEARAVCALNNCVRHDIYHTLLQKGYQQYHSQDSGEYLSWLTNDIKQLEKLAWNPFFNMVGSIARIICSTIALALLHWSMLVAALGISAVMWAAPRLFKKRLSSLSEESARDYAAGVSRLKDLLAGFDVLRSFGRGDRFLANGDRAGDEMEKANCRVNYVKEAVGCGVACISVGMQVLADVLIIVLVLHGKLNLAVWSGGSNLTSGISNGLSSLANQFLSIAAAKPYFKKLGICTESDLTAPVSACLQSAITMEDLSFSYDEKLILQNVCFRFEKSGKYALTGPSGCGKSTILKLLMGWFPDYQGSICFDGKDIRKITQEQLLEQMSYIEQDVFLFNTTIRDNITLGFDFNDEMLERAIKCSALDGDLANMPLGLDTPVGEHGNNLSGGQKQRVAIARALIHNRSILLIDEGTCALDQRNADIVEQSLLSNSELTLILVSHHLTEERKAQFTKVYEIEPVAAISEDT
jgi:ATP-binding cassette subfamily B protein